MNTKTCITPNKFKALLALYRYDRPLILWEICQLACLQDQDEPVEEWLEKWLEEGLTDRRIVHQTTYEYWLTEQRREFVNRIWCPHCEKLNYLPERPLTGDDFEKEQLTNG